MENLYPAFAGGRILKKEGLWAIRDYAYGTEQLHYQEASDGILGGLNIDIEEDCIMIGKGLIKYDGFIYMAGKPAAVSYEARDRLQVLKIRCGRDQIIPDYDHYRMEFYLTGEVECQAGEFEICRFNLQSGSKLRNDYKAFYDIETQYDTINLAEADWSGSGEMTLHPHITRTFARELLVKDGLCGKDYAFAYLALNSREALNREIILSYIARQDMEMSRKEIFTALEQRLRFFGQDYDQKAQTKRRNEPMILVD